MKNDNLNDNIEKKALEATKWSYTGEVCSKLVIPLINMILARILIPADFGMVAISSMIITFIEMFTDAGFQKYIIQHDFKSEEEMNMYASIAFWSNLILAMVGYVTVVLFAPYIALGFGNVEADLMIKIASMQIIVSALSSSQKAILQRKLNFFTLFKTRMIVLIVPVVISLPLAFMGMGYWSLIIGNLIGVITNTVVIWKYSEWKPEMIYDIHILKKMFKFSFWSMLESVSIWLSSWADSLIIGFLLTSELLGLYRNSINAANSIIFLVAAPIVPILFSMLSRYQDDIQMFNASYLKFKHIFAALLFPTCIGLFLYGDLAASILLGDNWKGAGKIISIWSLFYAVSGISTLASEVYRAKGIPKISILVQGIQIILIIPVCMYYSQISFMAMVIARSAIRLIFVPINTYFIKKITGLRFSDSIKEIWPVMISTSCMVIGNFIISIYAPQNIVVSIIKIVICICIYIATMLTIDKKTVNHIISVIPINLFKKEDVNL